MPEHVMQKVHQLCESHALFVERGLAAIEDTQRLGNDLPAEQVTLLLESAQLNLTLFGIFPAGYAIAVQCASSDVC